MKRKKILIIDNSIDVTGALKSIANSCFLLKSSFDFAFVLPQHSRGRSFLESCGFLNIHELPLRELSRQPASWLMYIPILWSNAVRLKRLIQKEQIQLIHVNDLYNLLPVAIRILGATTPYICHVRFLPDRFPKKLFSFWIKAHISYASHIICVSNFLKNQVSPNPKIKMIYDGHPISEQLPSPNRPSDILLYVSNIIKGKGLEYAIEAFSQLATTYPHCKLRLVGSDMGLAKNRKFKMQLLALCQQRGISRQVEWIDFVREVEPEYKSAKVFLNFSDSESFSMTCLEAQFYGCPVIATRSGGPAEIIVDQQTGFLVPKADINAMVLAMRKLLNNDLLRNQFAEEGRRRAQQEFSSAHTTHRLQELYYTTLPTQ